MCSARLARYVLGAGHGVEGQVAGADFDDAGSRGGVEVGCGGFDGGQLSVVVAGEQLEVVSGVGGVVVHRDELDLAPSSHRAICQLIVTCVRGKTPQPDRTSGESGQAFGAVY